MSSPAQVFVRSAMEIRRLGTKMVAMRPIPRVVLDRRSVLMTGLAASCGVALSIGGPLTDAASATTNPKRYRYGTASSLQFGDLWLPSGNPTALVVLFHGGSFKAKYHASGLNPVASKLASTGYAVWNVEYRSVGSGGGFPNTLLDAAAALDAVHRAGYDGNVVLVGHSAGGLLAAWSASRTSKTPGGARKQAIKGLVTLSGGLNLTELASYPGLSEQMIALMGGTPKQVPARYAVADPTLLLPPACPVYAVQAAQDTVVPPDEARSYVTKVKSAGGKGIFTSVPGTHASLIDPKASSWPTIAALIKRAAAS